MKRKRVLASVLVCSMLLPGCGKKAEKIPEYEGYHLLWNDEFDGEELNKDNWTMEFRLRGATNHELQAYALSEENVYVEDGNLVLRAIKNITETGGAAYTSGKVNTDGKHTFMYGKVEVRAKMPAGKGLWPAIWMLPVDMTLYGNWPTCGEIDIMEFLGHDPSTSYSTIHYGAPHVQDQGYKKLTENDFTEDFHVFGLDWEPDVMRFYVDGEVVLDAKNWFCSFNGIERLEEPAPFNQEFYLMLNLAVGGDWPGNPDETTDFENAKFEIDYVRVYQKDGTEAAE